jgi:hypothetical protein
MIACTVGFVVPLRRAAVALCGLLLLHGPLHAAVLIHEYALRGSLEDNLGGSPLTDVGGQITTLGYVFAANQGLSFSSRDFTPSNYSVELSFKFDSNLGTSKILDFHNLTSNPGLYAQDGRLSFAPAASSSLLDFTPGMDVHVVLTRDGATNLVTAYVNGQERFSFYDHDSLASPPGLSNKLNFFLDDTADGQASGGTLNYLRVFNGALNANDVNALFAGGPPIGVPEPSTYALMAIGVLTVALDFRRRRHRS